jgi:acyl-CoA reductase-like NAD-dependent aldehyde dehydrogenase
LEGVIQQVFCERRQGQHPIPFPDRRKLERRQILQDVIFERHIQQPSIQKLKSISLEIAIPAQDLQLQTFTLLVNGEDIDTGKYEYFPYANKIITDFRTTLHIIKQLKIGKIQEDYKEYIFAKYCIGENDTNQGAIRAAHEASKEFRFFPLAKRVKIMTDIYDLLMANKELLIDLMVIEGHPRRLAEWEFLGMEQAYRKQSLEFYKDNITRKVGTVGQEVLYWKRQPDGVVCVCPPRNAPCSSSLIAGFALLGGNALIIKPPLRSPISTIFLWRNIVYEALKINAAPPGTLGIILGNSEFIMNEWIISPHVDDILFIGESNTGLKLANRVFQYGKKPILELSGNDIMFIWKDAALDEAVESLLDGFLGSMQICMVPKKAFIHEEIYEAFEQAFLARVTKLKIGLPSDPEVTLTPVVRIAEFYEFLDDAIKKGGELLCGGEKVDHHMIADQYGCFITPAVIRITDSIKAIEMRCIQEENFFPLMPLVKVSARDVGNGKPTKDMSIFMEMVNIANNNEYGLRASAWVNSSYYIRKFMDNIHNSGLLRINSRHTGFSPYLATHGGRGKSGGPYGEMNYMWEKTTHLQGVSLTRMNKRDK